MKQVASQDLEGLERTKLFVDALTYAAEQFEVLQRSKPVYDEFKILLPLLKIHEAEKIREVRQDGAMRDSFEQSQHDEETPFIDVDDGADGGGNGRPRSSSGDTEDMSGGASCRQRR